MRNTNETDGSKQKGIIWREVYMLLSEIQAPQPRTEVLYRNVQILCEASLF